MSQSEQKAQVRDLMVAAALFGLGIPFGLIGVLIAGGSFMNVQYGLFFVLGAFVVMGISLSVMYDKDHRHLWEKEPNGNETTVQPPG